MRTFMQERAAQATHTLGDMLGDMLGDQQWSHERYRRWLAASLGAALT